MATSPLCFLPGAAKNERLIGYVPKGHEDKPSFDGVRADAERLLGVEVEAVNWFSTYRVHHRVADRFRSGRCFLLGDAGHLHSPVGGQGMNTGIGDAVNLSWKLAETVTEHASPKLLETYEPERISFARNLVATTDRMFQIITNAGLFGRVFRTWVMPHVLPTVTRFRAGRHAMFRVLSQTRIAYPDSQLSEGRAGRLAGGDRLPWVEDADNFKPLKRLNWQLHVFGEAATPILATAMTLQLPVERFKWSEAAGHAGFRRDSVYLIRPDGYIAMAMETPDGQQLQSYTARFKLRFKALGPAAQLPSVSVEGQPELSLS